MIVYEHTFPVAAIVLTLAAGLALGGFTAWRFLPRRWPNAGLFGLYALVLAGVGWCLLLPGQKSAVTQLLKPRFLIALDTSRSMALTPAPGVPTRWATATEALRLPWLQAVSAECEVELFPFATDVGEHLSAAKAVALAPDGSATRLRDALKQIADRSAGLPVAGMLLLSDGTDTREALDDWATAERPFPIQTVRLEPPGGWQQEPDLRLDSVTTARRVTVGWKSELKVKVSGQGTRGAAVTVQVFENGTLRTEKPTAIPDEGGERELTFEFEHPERGVFNYRVFVPPLPGEKNRQDNEFALSVEVIDARNRLLYVEGIPRWEYKFLRRTLLGEQQISPVIFFTGPDGTPRGGTPVGNVTADMTPAQLGFFKIVMLGNIDAREFGETRARALAKFVEDGGSLILLGGTKAWAPGGLVETELGKTLPVRSADLKTLESEKPYPVKLTEAARAHPAFAGDAALWQNIPPVLSVFSGFTLSPAAEALVTAETPEGSKPLVVTQRFGQGKVTAILTDSLWRWQLGPEASQGRPYERFWSQLFSWLLPREESVDQSRLELLADRDQLYLGEALALQARVGADGSLKPESVEVKLTLPEGREVPYRMSPQQVAMASGRAFPGFSLTYPAEAPGLYKAVATARLKDRTLTSEPFSFFVKPYSPETVPRPARTELLQTLSNASGGQFFESLPAMNDGLTNLKFKATEEKSADYRTLWREWPLLATLMTFLATTWSLRKFRNMP